MKISFLCVSKILSMTSCFGGDSQCCVMSVNEDIIALLKEYVHKSKDDLQKISKDWKIDESGKHELRVKEQHIMMKGQKATVYRIFIRLAEKISQDVDIGWMSHENVNICLICGIEFGLFVWPHHCRCCGNLVCHDCSPITETVNELKDLGEVRVCTQCCWGQTPVYAVMDSEEVSTKPVLVAAETPEPIASTKIKLLPEPVFVVQATRKLNFKDTGNSSMNARSYRTLYLNVCKHPWNETLAKDDFLISDDVSRNEQPQPTNPDGSNSHEDNIVEIYYAVIKSDLFDGVDEEQYGADEETVAVLIKALSEKFDVRLIQKPKLIEGSKSIGNIEVLSFTPSPESKNVCTPMKPPRDTIQAYDQSISGDNPMARIQNAPPVTPHNFILPDFVEKTESEYFNNEGGDEGETSYAIYNNGEIIVANESMLVEENPQRQQSTKETETHAAAVITPVETSEEEILEQEQDMEKDRENEANTTDIASASMLSESQDPYSIYGEKEEIVEVINDSNYIKANHAAVEIVVPVAAVSPKKETAVEASAADPEDQEAYAIYEEKEEIVEVVNDPAYIKANHAPVEIRVPVVEKQESAGGSVAESNEPYPMYKATDDGVVPQTANPFARSRSSTAVSVTSAAAVGVAAAAVPSTSDADSTATAELVENSSTSSTVEGTEPDNAVITADTNVSDVVASTDNGSTTGVSETVAVGVTVAAVVAAAISTSSSDNNDAVNETESGSTPSETTTTTEPVSETSAQQDTQTTAPAPSESDVNANITVAAGEETIEQAENEELPVSAATIASSSMESVKSENNIPRQDTDESAEDRGSESAASNSAAFRNISVESAVPDLVAALTLAAADALAADEEETTAEPPSGDASTPSNNWVVLRTKRDDRIRVYVNLLIDDTIPKFAQSGKVDTEIYTKFSLEKKYFYMKIDNFQEKGDINKRKDFNLSLDVSVLPEVKNVVVQDSDLTNKFFLKALKAVAKKYNMDLDAKYRIENEKA